MFNTRVIQLIRLCGLRPFARGAFVVTLCAFLSSQNALADWAAFKDFFKARSDEITTQGTLSEMPAKIGLTPDEITRGLKSALQKGAQSAVSSLGRPDGFLKNADVKIPVPPHLSMVEQGLRVIGQDAKADLFIEGINRAAEQAVPQAAAVFGEAIGRLTISDARAILDGGNQSATEYLRRTSAQSLRERFKPIVDAAIDNVGVTKQYQELLSKVDMATRLVDMQKLDLGNYVTEKALNGVFLMVGNEEQKIRENPAARTTELLKRVFGN